MNWIRRAWWNCSAKWVIPTRLRSPCFTWRIIPTRRSPRFWRFRWAPCSPAFPAAWPGSRSSSGTAAGPGPRGRRLVDNQRAKEILRLYRPGTLDALDPQMAEALQEVQRDPALADWFNQQCGVCIALRSKLKQIEVPPDLKRKILLGNIGRRRVISLRRPAPILAAAAALALLAAGVWFMLTPK